MSTNSPDEIHGPAMLAIGEAEERGWKIDPSEGVAQAATPPEKSARWDQTALDIVDKIEAAPTDWHPTRRKAYAQCLIIDALFGAALPASRSGEVVAWEPLRTLVDWVHLYATEGHSWISTHTADKLIALSARKPTQADADLFKRGASLKDFPSAARPPASAERGALEKALDDSQSLLAMILHLGTSAGISPLTWHNEDLTKLLTDQIVANRAALSQPSSTEPRSAELRETDKDHPDCRTEREKELYFALMTLYSAVASRRQEWRNWMQGGVNVAAVVNPALRLTPRSPAGNEEDKQ